MFFFTLDHDLYISGKCCNYFLYSLDPGESIDNNYSITWAIKNILTQEKRIFSVLSKSNVDEAEILVEIYDNSENLKNPIFIDFDSIQRKI